MNKYEYECKEFKKDVDDLECSLCRIKTRIDDPKTCVYLKRKEIKRRNMTRITKEEIDELKISGIIYALKKKMRELLYLSGKAIENADAEDFKTFSENIKQVGVNLENLETLYSEIIFLQK